MNVAFSPRTRCRLVQNACPSGNTMMAARNTAAGATNARPALRRRRAFIVRDARQRRPPSPTPTASDVAKLLRQSRVQVLEDLVGLVGCEQRLLHRVDDVVRGDLRPDRMRQRIAAGVAADADELREHRIGVYFR